MCLAEMPLNFPPATPYPLPRWVLPAAERCAGNASASAPSVPVIFRRNGPEEIRQPDNEHVHLVGRDAPSQGSGLLRCHRLALKKRRILDGPPGGYIRPPRALNTLLDARLHAGLTVRN